MRIRPPRQAVSLGKPGRRLYDFIAGSKNAIHAPTTRDSPQRPNSADRKPRPASVRLSVRPKIPTKSKTENRRRTKNRRAGPGPIGEAKRKRKTPPSLNGPKPQTETARHGKQTERREPGIIHKSTTAAGIDGEPRQARARQPFSGSKANTDSRNAGKQESRKAGKQTSADHRPPDLSPPKSNDDQRRKAKPEQTSRPRKARRSSARLPVPLSVRLSVSRPLSVEAIPTDPLQRGL